MRKEEKEKTKREATSEQVAVASRPRLWSGVEFSLSALILISVSQLVERRTQR